MRLRPRTICFRAFISLALALTLASTSFSLQRDRAKPSSTAQNKEPQRAQREQTINLLVETADKSRLFDDLLYRARIQMLVADALWPVDEEQARAIFRRAWEAATASDKAEREQEAAAEGARPGSVARITESRDEVIKKAATRDPQLAEVFLRDLSNEVDGAGVDNNKPGQHTTWHDLSASGALRLALAYETLEAGAAHNAVLIAAPLVNEGVSADLIAFIQSLRERSASDADALYMQLVARAAADPQTDAAAVLLLSSPVITPSLLIAVDESGSLQFRALPITGANHAMPQAANAQAQTAFYNLAAAVLSRPAASGDERLTMQDLMTRFYATGRLLPYFENSSAPYSIYAPTLRSRQSELFNQIEASRRDQASSQFNVNSLTQTAQTDPLRVSTEQLARATNPAERESIALTIVKTAVRYKAWDRARRVAAEIEDTDKRRLALSFIQANQIKDISDAFKDERENDYEGLVKFIRNADVPPFAKAWGLAEAARVAARSSKRNAQTARRTAGLLNEAEGYAARVEQGTPERVAAYGAIVMAAAQVDVPRAWKTLRELVRAANSADDFYGDETAFSLTKDENVPDELEDFMTVETEVFRLDGIFATMAHLDFEKALTEARALDNHVPQAFAMIAIAKSRIQTEKQNSESRILRRQPAATDTVLLCF